MRERSKHGAGNARKPARRRGDVREARATRERGDGALSKPRKLMEQAWNDTLQYLDEGELISLRGMRLIGKSRLR